MHAIFHEIVSHFVNVNVSVKTALAKRLTLRYVCHLIQLGSRCKCFRDCWQLNPYNLPFVGITSKLQLHHRADLYSNNGPTQQYIYDYDMNRRTLIELANPYPHTPITMQSSRNAAGSGFRCMLKLLQMQFQFGCRLNNCLCSRQPSRFTPSNYVVRYIQ